MPGSPPADTAPPPTDAAAWRRAIAGAPQPPAVPFAGAPLLVLSAHPDDEVIGAGRLLADHGGPARCITLTAGERCHGPGPDADAVARTRLREWSEGLRTLGAEPVETPRWDDGSLADHEEAAVERLSAQVADAAAVLAPWRHDPHPDHRAAGRIGAAVARRAGIPLHCYLVWTPYWLAPGDLDRHEAELVRLSTSARAHRLWREALSRHRSQVLPHPPAVRPIVPEDLIRRHESQLLVQESHAAHA
jgi:LmbE family N-acetylglucosaminyl deacetylase